MAKKQKGKQKEEKPVDVQPLPQPPPVIQRVNLNEMAAENTQQAPYTNAPQPASWGTSGGGGWGDTAGQSWGGETHQVEETWEQSESLLHPPPDNSHSILPTIHEQPASGHSAQNGTPLSDIGESHDEYSDSWSNQHEDQSPQNWDGPQSRTLTATAAPSAIGSPAPPPVISLAEAAAVAQKDLQKQQKFSTASEAARRMEENRSHPMGSPMASQHSAMPPAGHYDHARAVQSAAGPKQPMSSASAAAAAIEASMNRNRAQTQQSQPEPNGKTTWTYPKPFLPNARQPARIPIDPSWTMTGGNTWSNKHRATKSTSASNWPQGNENAWNQQAQMHQFHQAQQARQAHQGQQRPQHHKHRSHPGHPMHQQQRPQAQQNQSWQGWGKEGWGQSQETDSESDAETLNGWGASNGGAAWGQAAGVWGQQQPVPKSKGEPKRERGRTRGRKAEEPQVQDDAWGQAAGEWGQGNGGWGQGAAEWKSASAWEQGNDAGQQAQPAEGVWGTGGDAWGEGQGHGQGDSGWGQTNEAAWGAGTGEWGAHPPSNAEWGAEPQQRSKVAFAVAEPAGSRNVLSPQQRSQILNSLLNQPQNQNLKAQAGHAPPPAVKQVYPQAKSQQQQQDKWGAWEAHDTGWGSVNSDDEEYDDNRRVHFSPKASDLWGGSPRSVPSKTLAQAQQGITTTLINDTSNVRFVESRGAGLAFVANAFFGNARLARERIHWCFPANKDERVAAMISWVQKMSFNLGTYGLMKFLETRERGALFVNAAFRMHQHPHEPAFDWLTFNQLQATMDKTIQESVAFYDPAALVIVFVFLPSQSGNSVAIWRRKVNVPDNARLKFQAEINAIVKHLRTGKEYIVMVDELPAKSKPNVPKKGHLRKSAPIKAKAKATVAATQAGTQPNAKKKRKWWKFFLS